MNQPGYYISNATTDLTAFTPGQDTPVTVTLTGAFDQRPVRARDLTNSRDLVTGSVPASETQSATILRVPPSGSWAPAQIMMQYLHGGTNQWTDIPPAVTMIGYSSMTFTASGTPHANGFAVTVTGSGYGPGIRLRAQVNGVPIGNETILAAGTTDRTADVIVPANREGIERTVDIKWFDPVIGDWAFIAQYTQEWANLTYNDKIIARDTIISTSWAEAAGIPLIYNTTLYSPTAGDRDAVIVPTQRTGCGAYSEPGLPTGWRLPAEREVTTYQHIPTGAFPTRIWFSSVSTGHRLLTSREVDADRIYHVTYNGGAGWTTYKTAPGSASIYTRCVHD